MKKHLFCLSLAVMVLIGFITDRSNAQSSGSIPERVTRLETEVATLKRRRPEKGESGTSGLQGPKGEKGDRGPQGPQGEPGIKLSNVNFGDGYGNFYNSSYTLTAVIGASAQGGGLARFWNKSGKEAALIGATTDGNGIALVYNNTGKKVAEIGVATEGGIANYYNNFDKIVSTIGNTSGGQGFARFYNKYGKEVIFIGATTSETGAVFINGSQVHDYAEVFELNTRDGVAPGTVMSVLESGVRLAPSTVPYDPKVVGVISGAGGYQPGMRIGTREDGSNDFPIAVNGMVYVRVCVEEGVIAAGDLLVSSSRTGVAMRASDRLRALGAVIGKALEPYKGEPASEGLIRMLVMSR